MDNTTSEQVVEPTEVEPPKNQNEKSQYQVEKGGRAKNLLRKKLLYNQDMLYNTIMRNAMFLFCVVTVVGNQQKPNYIDM